MLKLVGLCLLAGVLLAGVMFPVVGGLGVASNQASATVDNTSSELANIPPPLVTTVTDDEGKPIATLYEQYRIPTASDQISDAMKWAIISIEDRRFYEHNGVDWKGTMRAAISNTQGGDTQGASTLTQQYVKNYLINVVYGGDTIADKIGRKKAQEQTIARKLKEARISVQLETKMSKEQILTGYLNVVEFSRRIFGVGAAAHAYFGVEAKDLTVPQAALLAGMVNNPTMLDPWNFPERSKQRRNLVIDQMVINRKLAADDAERLKKEPLGVLPNGPDKPDANCIGAGPEHGFFCQYVEDYLISAGIDKDTLYRGGYTIKTTLDREANHHAKESAEAEVSRTQPDIANTLSLVRPGKERHEVVSLVANRDYGFDTDKGQTSLPLPSGIFNTTGAGSSYKIFTAAATLQEGVAGIYDTVQSPTFHRSDVFISNNPECGAAIAQATYPYCLRNFNANYPPSMTLQEALQTSPNTAFVILEEKAGMGAVVEMASKLGMRKSMAANGVGREPNPDAEDYRLRVSITEQFGPDEDFAGQGSFTLGPVPLSGLELANVGATIMSGGVWCPPTPIMEVTDRNGRRVDLEEKPCEQAVPEGLADTLAVGMSKDIVGGGTAAGAAAAFDWKRPMIGKTGTTQGNKSATFVGATPQLAGAGMVFRPDGGFSGLCFGGPGNVYTCDPDDGNMFGGRTPARTWFGAMTEIMEGEPEKPLPKASPKYEDMD